MIAITRAVPDQLQDCELTHQARVPIDVAKARHEHEQYEAALQSLGCSVLRLPALHDHPDSVFVEDTAVVVDECAVLARPGAASRRAEVASMRAILQEHRTVFEISAPGTLDGGDVLRLGRRLFVGISSRTNRQGAAQLREFLRPFGYHVASVPVAATLHLKSAATPVNEGLVVVNASAVKPDAFGAAYIVVPDTEPQGANVLAVNTAVLCPANAPATAALLRERGLHVVEIDNSELAKAEAGLTCCSILLRSSDAARTRARD